jgi:hypothetical protein
MHCLSRFRPILYLVPFVLAAAATGQTLNKLITYTRYAGPPNNVKQALFTYNIGLGTTSFATPTTVTTVPGADGVLFATDGDLIIGGQGNATHKVVVSNGSFATVTPGVQSFHVMLDPSGSKVWTAGNPGHLASVPITPFGPGTAHPLTGDDDIITHVVFTPNGAFYTSSYIFGVGHFGVIDMNTFTTTRLYSNVPWAHGMTLDCYSGKIVAFCNNHVAQIDPVSYAVVSVLDTTPLGFLLLDQGTSDGEGHLFIASNTGHMLFLDITLTQLVGNPDFVDLPFLDGEIDDIAPDCGLGAPPNCPKSQGYWKNHAWPVPSVMLGCQSYTEAQGKTLLGTPVGKRTADASIILAYQLIAAKVNFANNGNNWAAILPIIQQADALLCTFAGRLPYGTNSSSWLGQQMVALAAQLEDWNLGRLSPACGGH